MHVKGGRDEGGRGTTLRFAMAERVAIRCGHSELRGGESNIASSIPTGSPLHTAILTA